MDSGQRKQRDKSNTGISAANSEKDISQEIRHVVQQHFNTISLFGQLLYETLPSKLRDFKTRNTFKCCPPNMIPSYQSDMTPERKNFANTNPKSIIRFCPRLIQHGNYTCIGPNVIFSPICEKEHFHTHICLDFLTFHQV